MPERALERVADRAPQAGPSRPPPGALGHAGGRRRTSSSTSRCRTKRRVSASASWQCGSSCVAGRPADACCCAQRRAHARQRERQLHRVLLQRHLAAARRCARVRRGRRGARPRLPCCQAPVRPACMGHVARKWSRHARSQRCTESRPFPQRLDVLHMNPSLQTTATCARQCCASRSDQRPLHAGLPRRGAP